MRSFMLPLTVHHVPTYNKYKDQTMLQVVAFLRYKQKDKNNRKF